MANNAQKGVFNTEIVTTRCPQKFFRGRNLFYWDRLTPQIWRIPADGFSFEDSSPGYDPIHGPWKPNTDILSEVSVIYYVTVVSVYKEDFF